MDYGVTWDNEYVSVHMLEPDYSPMVGYPVAHTPGTDGRQVAQAVIVDLLTRADLEQVSREASRAWRCSSRLPPPSTSWR